MNEARPPSGRMRQGSRGRPLQSISQIRMRFLAPTAVSPPGPTLGCGPTLSASLLPPQFRREHPRIFRIPLWGNQLDKGKPSERAGRKVTGLWSTATWTKAAGPPKAEQQRPGLSCRPLAVTVSGFRLRARPEKGVISDAEIPVGSYVGPRGRVGRETELKGREHIN